MRTHGLLSTYKRGCHCPLCQTAFLTYWHGMPKDKKATLKKAMRHNHLWSRYRLSVNNYDQLYAKQKGLCAICNRLQRPAKHSLSVDHNHTTGLVCGLLCHKCNGTLGWYELFAGPINDYLLLTQGGGDC